jgi:hypothetical protein
MSSQSCLRIRKTTRGNYLVTPRIASIERFISVTLLEAIVMLLLLLAGLIGMAPDDSSQQLEFLRLSYRANKDAFAFGTFRFEYTTGNSASASDAESEIFFQFIKEEGFYVFDGENARYELNANPTELAAVTTRSRTDPRKSSSLATSFRMLTDGKVTLMDLLFLNQENTILHHKASIFPQTTLFRKRFEFPLYLGDDSDRPYDLFSDLTGIKNGKATLLELDLDSRLGDLKVCKLTYEYRQGKITYWIDLSRGSLPLRILDHYNPTNLDVTFIFGDLVQVSGAGWIPRRRLHILGNGAVVDRIIIKEIDTQSKPRTSIFGLDFPEPIGIVDQARKLAYSPRKTWSLLQLPSPSSPSSKPVSLKSNISPPEMPGELRPGSFWTITLPLGVIILLAIGATVVIRRRSRLRRV